MPQVISSDVLKTLFVVILAKSLKQKLYSKIYSRSRSVMCSNLEVISLFEDTESIIC